MTIRVVDHIQLFSIVLLLRRQIDNECYLVSPLSGHRDVLLDRGKIVTAGAAEKVQKQPVSSLSQAFEEKLPSAVHLDGFGPLEGCARAYAPVIRFHPHVSRQRAAFDLNASGDYAIAVSEDQAHAGDLVARVDVECFDLDAVALDARQREAYRPEKAGHDADLAWLHVG